MPKGRPRTLIFLLLVSWPTVVRAGQLEPELSSPTRLSYQIVLEIDVKSLSYWGQEMVRYLNTGQRPLHDIWFLLYPNLTSAANKGGAARLHVQGVEVAGTPTPFETRGLTGLKVILTEPLEPGETVELKLEFFGKIPEVNSQATTLSSHFTEQIRQVIGSRRHRVYLDTPLFACDRIMILSGFYPMVAPRRKDRWQTSVFRAVTDMTVTEAADYEVEVRVSSGWAVFASGETVARQEKPDHRRLSFRGRGLRDFLLIAGSDYHTESRLVGAVRVHSVFRTEAAVASRQVLRYAAEALAVYQRWFGPYPYSQLTIIEAPLPAGRMSVISPCLVVLANAYYTDFRHPTISTLPGLIRESAPLIEDALEFSVAYAVARQWWGLLVAADPEQAHFLDHALATYAALLYYEKSYSSEVAQAQIEAQLKAAYRIYRLFGGEDQPVNQPIDQFTNGFQYAAIVHVKGALFFEAVRRLMGDEAFATALRSYFHARCFGWADAPGLLRVLQRTARGQSTQIAQLYNRWIMWRRGDQDIAHPEYRIVVSSDLGPSESDRPSAFEWLGRFIARQMTWVGKHTVRPF